MLQKRTGEVGIDGILAEVFEYTTLGSGDMEFRLSAFSKGHGTSSEGSGILFPGDLMEDFEDLTGMPRWDVKVWLSDGTSVPVDISYVPLERFVYVASTAAILYSRILNTDFNPWPAIAGMQKTCTLAAQKARVPDEVRDYLGREHFD